MAMNDYMRCRVCGRRYDGEELGCICNDKEQDTMATDKKKSNGPVEAKKSGGATSFILPVEKECGGSIRYGDKEGRDTLPVSNVYVSRRTWTNMPKKIKVTIEPAD